MYGHRGRIGLIVPSSNTTIEPECYEWVPDGVAVYTARMTLESVNEQQLLDMADDIRACTAKLTTAQVDIVVFGCETGSLIKGGGYGEEIVSRINDVTGTPGIATSVAVIDALESLAVSKLAVATPHIEQMNDREISFLEANGFDVVDCKGLEIEPNIDIGRQVPDTSYRIAQSLYVDDVDAVYISSTNLRTFEIIEQLERDLDVPVISSNSATLWAALNHLGVDTSEIPLGTLFRT